MAVGMGADPRSRHVDFPALGRLASKWREVAPYYYGDFYPLTPYTTEDSAWMAWQFNRPATGDGMVQVFRRSQSPFGEVRFKLRGIDSAGQYSVTNLDASGESRSSGRELADEGLQVVVKDQPGAVIFVYKKAAVPR